MGWATWMACRVSRISLKSLRLAPSMTTEIGTPLASVKRLRLTPFFPRSVGLAPVFLTPTEALCSSRRQWPARTNQCPPTGRRPEVPASRTLQTPRHRSIPGTSDRPTHRNRSLSHPTSSIEPPYEEQTGSHSSHPDPAPEDCAPLTGEVFWRAVNPPSCSTVLRSAAIRRRVRSTPFVSSP